MNVKNNNLVTQSQDFWEDKYHNTSTLQEPNFFPHPESSDEQMFVSLLGNIEDKEILEIGCGNGSISLFLAKNGAKVTTIDFSENAINNTLNLANQNQLTIEGYQLNALNIDELGKKFDLVVGKYILHHIEPFAKFSDVLASCLKDNGRCVFIENNSRNPILMLARNNLAGKFGIPKYGDKEEHPFEPREVELLKNNVGNVKIHYPNFVFFRKLNSYIFKQNQKFELLMNFFTQVDNFIYQYLPILNQYSYVQLIEIHQQIMNE